jgi:hypothetical protein
MNQEKRAECINWIKTSFPMRMKREIKEAMNREPDRWWIGAHFGWGMWCRNQMRSHGYGEQEMGVDNLDDYYVDMVEEAIDSDDIPDGPAIEPILDEQVNWKEGF